MASPPPVPVVAPPLPMTPLITVAPEPATVSVLMIVFTLPLTVSVLPAAVVQVCGAPIVIGELIVTLSLALMPPAVTVSEPPEKT